MSRIKDLNQCDRPSLFTELAIDSPDWGGVHKINVKRLKGLPIQEWGSGADTLRKYIKLGRFFMKNAYDSAWRYLRIGVRNGYPMDVYIAFNWSQTTTEKIKIVEFRTFTLKKEHLRRLFLHQVDNRNFDLYIKLTNTNYESIALHELHDSRPASIMTENEFQPTTSNYIVDALPTTGEIFESNYEEYLTAPFTF